LKTKTAKVQASTHKLLKKELKQRSKTDPFITLESLIDELLLKALGVTK
jgi:hypothetical protein